MIPLWIANCFLMKHPQIGADAELRAVAIVVDSDSLESRGRSRERRAAPRYGSLFG